MLLQAPEPQTFVVQVQEQHVIDYRGLRHFDLITPQGRLSVMGDADVPLIQALGTFRHEKVRITLAPDRAEKLER